MLQGTEEGSSDVLQHACTLPVMASLGYWGVELVQTQGDTNVASCCAASLVSALFCETTDVFCSLLEILFLFFNCQWLSAVCNIFIFPEQPVSEEMETANGFSIIIPLLL